VKDQLLAQLMAKPLASKLAFQRPDGKNTREVSRTGKQP
jgi:hypothetical protein